jgi:hypothetical protein
MITLRFFAFSALAVLPLVCSTGAELTVKTSNKLEISRPDQTVELSGKDLAPLGDLQKIHIKDSAGKEILCQAVDTDFDNRHTPDILIFQTDFKPKETKKFSLTFGSKHVYKKEQFKAHGRFVRERFDDFAWENDRIAHRMYGKALETWAGEPLTSSTVDIWSKRVPQMVIDEWYMTDNYHSDSGQGADFYSAGPSRGCGGNGLWADNKLWVSKNFVNSRALANGPVRVTFELIYEPFNVNGKRVSEIKRITLDAGSQLDHFQSFYKSEGDPGALTTAIGLRKVAGEEKHFDPAHGCLAVWQKVDKNNGMQGVAILVSPKDLVKESDDKFNNLLLAKVAPDNSVSYWAGFAWDKAGQFTTFEAWEEYLKNISQTVHSPIEVSIQKP